MNDYEDFLAAQQLGEKTIYAYLGAIKSFGVWYFEKHDRELNVRQLQEEELAEYSTHLRHTRNLVPDTINKHLAAIRKWLEMHKRSGGWVHEIILPDVKKQKKKRAPKWLEPTQVSAVLYAVDQEKNEFLRARDKCILYLELYRGIRIGESMALQIHDVIMTPGRQKIIIREGKGGKYDEIDISNSRKIKGAIQEWLDIRATAVHAYSSFFFISFRSGKVTVGAINKMVDRIRERSHTAYTTHQLRHTFIHNIERESKDLRLTHEVARHSSIDTTMLYTTPSEKEVAAIYRAVEDKY
jgi:integrase/recombinase XerD